VLQYCKETNQFSISEEYAALLLDPKDSSRSMAGYFQAGPALVHRISELDECFESGLGRTYDDEGTENLTKGIERAHYNIFHNILCDNLLPNENIMNGNLVQLLSQGKMIAADVGCGTGVALIEMARRFPKAMFHGFELSKQAISAARKNVELSKLSNVRIFDVSETAMPPSAYDFVFCYDVLHDCSQPGILIKQVKEALKPQAPFVIVEIECFKDVSENIHHPMAESRYGFSLGLCLQSGCSEQGGMGIGTCGLYPERLFGMLRKEGFKNYKVFQVEQLKGQNCYVAR